MFDNERYDLSTLDSDIGERFGFVVETIDNGSLNQSSQTIQFGLDVSFVAALGQTRLFWGNIFPSLSLAAWTSETSVEGPIIA